MLLGLAAQFHERASEFTEVTLFRDGSGSLHISESTACRHFLVVAHESDGNLVAGAEFIHLLHKLRMVVHFHSIDGGDHVILLESEFLGRAHVVDRGDEHTALHDCYAFLLGKFGIQFYYLTAEHGTLYGTILPDVGDNFLDNGSGDCEGEAGVASGVGIYC